MVDAGRPTPLEANYRPSAPFDHEPHGIGRFASAALFCGLWAGFAGIAFWRTTPPDHAGLMWAIGGVLAAIAGFAVAKIKPLRPRRRVSLALGVVCAVLPFLLVAVLR